MKGVTSRTVSPQVAGMFFNVRGLEDDLDDILEYMSEKDIVFACFAETKVFGRSDHWRYIRGPECLPGATVSGVQEFGFGPDSLGFQCTLWYER